MHYHTVQPMKGHKTDHAQNLCQPPVATNNLPSSIHCALSATNKTEQEKDHRSISCPPRNRLQTRRMHKTRSPNPGRQYSGVPRTLVLFQKAAFRVLISVAVNRTMELTAAIFCTQKAGPALSKACSSQRTGRHISTREGTISKHCSHKSRTCTSFISLHKRIGDSHALACVEIVENLAEDLKLKTFFIYRCSGDFFLAGPKAVQIQSCPMAILSSL